MEQDLKLMARRGEMSQYILMAVCIGIVLIASVAVIPAFSCVIQDKSYVLALFADIGPEEIEGVIAEMKRLDIKTLHFKRKWLRKYQTQQDEFWKKVIGEHRGGYGQHDRGTHSPRRKGKQRTRTPDRTRKTSPNHPQKEEGEGKEKEKGKEKKKQKQEQEQKEDVKAGEARHNNKQSEESKACGTVFSSIAQQYEVAETKKPVLNEHSTNPANGKHTLNNNDNHPAETPNPSAENRDAPEEPEDPGQLEKRREILGTIE